MTANSQLSTTKPKKKTTNTKQKQKETKQLAQEQSHRNTDHIDGYQWGRRGVNVRKGTGNK